MSARPGPCGGRSAMTVPTAIQLRGEGLKGLIARRILAPSIARCRGFSRWSSSSILCAQLTNLSGLSLHRLRAE
jgi:hypothetical protein